MGLDDLALIFFLRSFSRTQLYLRNDLSLRPSVNELPFWNLNVTQADQATNSISTIMPIGAIQGNMAMWLNPVDSFGTNTSCATGWPNFKRMQVVRLGDPIFNNFKWRPLVAMFVTDASTISVICNQCKWCHLVAKLAISWNSAIEIKFELSLMKDLKSQ